MNKKLLLGTFLIVSMMSRGQQDPQFTHFMYDKLSINPGVAGTSEAICFTGIFRNQWGGFGQEPKTGLLNLHAPIDQIKGGLGGTYYYDQLGWEINNMFRLSYSYHLKNIGPGSLGLGLSAGYFQKKINPAWIVPDTEAGSGNNQDNSIPTSNNADGSINFSLGAYYYASNFYAGLSTTHLTQSELSSLNVQSVRHYYIMGGYTYPLPVLNGDFELKPNALIKTDAVSTQFDVNLTVMFRKLAWLGVTYRNQDAVAPMAGLQYTLSKYGTVKLGYAYDVTTSNISGYSNGTHEIMLNYCFSISRNKPFTRTVHPRFL